MDGSQRLDVGLREASGLPKADSHCYRTACRTLTPRAAMDPSRAALTESRFCRV